MRRAVDTDHDPAHRDLAACSTGTNIEKFVGCRAHIIHLDRRIGGYAIFIGQPCFAATGGHGKGIVALMGFSPGRKPAGHSPVFTFSPPGVAAGRFAVYTF
jgi:hypothetical protein